MAETPVIFLRRFVAHNFKKGRLDPRGTFKCNQGLSFYDRSFPLDTAGGARDLCEYESNRSVKDPAKDPPRYGVFELSADDLGHFSLTPRHEPDDSDPVYGGHHYGTQCLEDVYPFSEPPTLAEQQLLNRKKGELAAIAEAKIVISTEP